MLNKIIDLLIEKDYMGMKMKPCFGFRECFFFLSHTAFELSTSEWEIGNLIFNPQNNVLSYLA
jgi:hypothetical protein